MRKALKVLVVSAFLSLPFKQPITNAQDSDLQRAVQLSQQLEKLYRQGKYTEAVPIAKEALAIREKALGPDHLDVALTLNNLAMVYLELGDYASAESLTLRSLL